MGVGMSAGLMAVRHSASELCWFVVDAKRVRLLRYNDPVLGPRRLPNFENFTDEKSVIEASETFSVDTEKQVVMLQRGTDSNVAIGSQLVYVTTS